MLRWLAILISVSGVLGSSATAAQGFDETVFRSGFEDFVCPNGVIEDAETCDDGDAKAGDGCSDLCRIEFGNYCQGAPSVCVTLCGDGFRASTEACDDGNGNPGDGCNTSCAIESGFSCSGTPSVCSTICGDGVVTGGEACDDGNGNPGDGCDASCAIETGFSCSGTPSVCSTICGDGVTAGGEACDDGNPDETDGCTTQCLTGKVCNATVLPGADRFAVDPANGRCYASYDDEMTTFSAAGTACTTAGGTLATLTSEGEAILVDAVRNSAQNPWIGATEDGGATDDGMFAWVTGEPFVYTRFAAGEPDNDSAGGGNGDCLHITNAAGEWADTQCQLDTFVIGRICELEP